MDIQFGKKINELAILWRELFEAVKNTFRLFSNELRPLSDVLRYLAEGDINSSAYSDPSLQPFWQQFGGFLNDCHDTLQTLARILKDVNQLDNAAREMRLRETEELRLLIVPFSKTMNIALQIMTISTETEDDIRNINAALRELTREIGQTTGSLRTCYEDTSSRLGNPVHGTGRIISNLERCMLFAGEWASSKLKELPEFSIAESFETARRSSLSAGYLDLPPEDPVPQVGIIRIFSHQAEETDSITNLPLGMPDLEKDIIRHYQDIASDRFAAGDYRQAEAILHTLLDELEATPEADTEWRDKAMVMLGAAYCKLGNLQAADKLIQGKSFSGKDEIMEMLTISYCRQSMWREAERLLKNHFDGRDEVMRKLAEEFYQEGKWNEAETLLRSEFEGRDAILELLGLAYCEQHEWERAENIVNWEFEGKEKVMDMIAAGYCQYGRLEEAGEIVHQLLKRRPIRTDTLITTYELAKQYLIQEDFKRAEYYCLTTIKGREIEPEKGHLYYLPLTLLIRVYEAQGKSGKAEMCKVLLPKGKIFAESRLITGYREVDRLSQMDPESAASEMSIILKDLVPNLTRDDSQEIISNILSSGNGLMGSGYGFSLLHAFARCGDVEIVHLLLDKGANIDALDNRGSYTPLIYAARDGHTKVVELLLDRGANIDARVNDGTTAVIQAARNGWEEIVGLLLEHETDIEAKDNDHCTALIYAAWKGHEKITKLLLDKGANIHAKGKNQYNALILAAREGHETIVDLLLDNGADIEAKDHLNNTPLLRATLAGHESVVRLLLDRGADPEAESDIRKFAFGRRMKAKDLVPKGRPGIKMLLNNASVARRNR